MKGENDMIVIVKEKRAFTTQQYNGIKNIAYNATTRIYTITLPTDSTVTFSADDYLVAIMFG